MFSQILTHVFESFVFDCWITYILYTVVGPFLSTKLSLSSGYKQHNRSFSHVLRQRYLLLRHDTTIFALVQILTEVAFPDQEIKYNRSILSQTQFYQKPRYQVPSYDHTKFTVSVCSTWRELNPSQSHAYLKWTKERFKPCQKMTNHGEFLFPLEPLHAQNLSSQTFPANTFLQSSVISPKWSWNDLPKSLTESSHMILDDISMASSCTGMDYTITAHADCPGPSLNTLSCWIIIILILCLSILYLIIPVHAQYHPRRCSSMFVFVFVIVTCHLYLVLLVCYYRWLSCLVCNLTQRVTGEFHWKHCQ